jgi:hypothetical protein
MEKLTKKKLKNLSCVRTHKMIDSLWPWGVYELSLPDIISIGCDNEVDVRDLDFVIWKIDENTWEQVTRSIGITPDILRNDEETCRAIVQAYYKEYCYESNQE